MHTNITIPPLTVFVDDDIRPLVIYPRSDILLSAFPVSVFNSKNTIDVDVLKINIGSYDI